MSDYNQQYILDRIVEDENGCWNWQACTDRLGYGQVRKGGCGESLAHRLSYRVFKGSVEGLVVRHTCDNPSCVNPDHLVAGTQGDNLSDMRQKGRGGAPPLKLTDEQVLEIRRELAQENYYGKQRKLARRYNVSDTTICEIKQGTKR